MVVQFIKCLQFERPAAFLEPTQASNFTNLLGFFLQEIYRILSKVNCCFSISRPGFLVSRLNVLLMDSVVLFYFAIKKLVSLETLLSFYFVKAIRT